MVSFIQNNDSPSISAEEIPQISVLLLSITAPPELLYMGLYRSFRLLLPYIREYEKTTAEDEATAYSENAQDSSVKDCRHRDFLKV